MEIKNNLIEDIDKLLKITTEVQYTMSVIKKADIAQNIDLILIKVNAMKNPPMEAIGQLEAVREIFQTNDSHATCEDIKTALKKLRDDIC